MNNPQLRIGDAEREAAARELGEHYAQGRITTDEHSERLDRIWAARTAADLAPAFSDLPRPRPEPVPTPPRGSRGPRGPRAWQGRVVEVVSPLPFLLKVLIGVVLIALVISHLPLVVVALLFYVFCVRRLAHRRPRGPRWH